jgi:hypothetical protein
MTIARPARTRATPPPLVLPATEAGAAAVAARSGSASHARGFRRATALLVAAVGVGLGAIVPAAGATVIATSRSGFEGGPALGSDGRVVVGERRGNGALRLLAVDPATRARAVLASYPSLADARTYPTLSLWGTGGFVTAALDIYRQVADEENATPQLLSTRTAAISPAAVALGACKAPPQPSQDQAAHPQLDARGGDGFVATVGDDCGASTTFVRIRGNGTPVIPAAPGTTTISQLRASGPMISWVENGGSSPVTRTLVVARAATGQVLLRTPLDRVPYQLSLGADGTVVLPDFPNCAMSVVSPAAPAPRPFSLTFPQGAPCLSESTPGRVRTAVSVAAGRVAYAAMAFSGYAVSDLQGNAHPLAEASLRDGNVLSPTAFDGRTVYVVRSDCDADRLLSVDADVVGTVLAPRSGRPCPVRRVSSGHVRVLRDGRISIHLRCARGCRGTLRLVQQRRGGRERLVGRASYAGAAGTVVVRPRIARYAKALAGCSGGLRVTALLHPAGDDEPFLGGDRGTSLGAYRIASGTRCARSGGPAFTAPRGGPRP